MTADAVGGVWQYALQLTSLLSRLDVDVMVATMGPSPSIAQQSELLAIPGASLRSRACKLEWMPDAWADVDAAGEWLLGLESGFLPDIVHLNGYAHGSSRWRAPTLIVAHSCVSSWWEAVHRDRPPVAWSEYVARVKAGLTAATAVAAPTHAMAGALARLYGVSREIAVIPNCRVPRCWRPGTKEPFVFSAGRVWDPAKNLTTLDRVADNLPWPVYTAGDTTLFDGDAVHLRGVRALGRLGSAEIGAWMSRAAIYVLPARYEPFGLSVLEAALAGCALVLGDIPSLRENWSGVARFVHPERPDELQRALQELIADPAHREHLATAARRRGLTFSPAKHVAAYERLYREMVALHGRTAHSARTL